ncbi:hypothetical protein ACLPJF_08345 [Pseudomonas vlassakiae]|uniref:hypothetical protein n=1 Tax=Pseudomonas TaxID=286 RepID=UPI000C1A1987|nr:MULTISPECIES: hypothetical protein [unclassified Pseudomonas]MBS3186323.1 hypothetical protein [Pseudomonas sp. PCH44]PIK77866.1 hypothetical protein CQW31_14400 [Pseudomonas sp. 382]
MSNSMKQLLERMSKGSVTEGWGAVAAYSRSRLNRLLEQQYLARLEDNSYLPPFSEVLAGQAVGQRVRVQRLEFGAPLLSFSSASMENSRATLTMNIVSGTLDKLGTLISSTVVTEALGLWVQLEVDLEVVVGEVSRYGRVSLNLSHAATITSNLFENTPDLNALLTAALQDWIHALPARYAVFELGTVDFSGYDPLAPTRFIIRTQAAPGARVLGALNHGDGAVLVFIQLRANAREGMRPGSNYPYLIPDGDYSATLVLNENLLHHASDQGLELLARLLFPELNAFVKREDHTPRDRALFGNIDPLRTQLTLEPALGAVIVAGERQQFTLRDGFGQPVTTGVSWRALSPQSHTEAGHGVIDARGLYQAPAIADMGNELITAIVTAEREEAGQTYRAAARLLVCAEHLLVTPSAGAFRPQQEQGLDVWNAGPKAASFELLEPRLGELAILGDKSARFVPYRQTQRRLLAVQQVQASAGEQRNAALIMVNGEPLLPLEPPFMPRLGHGRTTQLSEVNRIMPNQARRWRMLAGAGSVTPSGLFQASAQQQPQSNVVACEVVHNGVVFASGYSVLKQTDLAENDTWKALSLFTITVGKSGSGTVGNVASSGYQQLEVEITVQTQAVDGKDYKLSIDEIATLALYDRSGQVIASLADSEEGIAEDEGPAWRTSRVKNRFVLANDSQPVVGEGAAPHGDEDRTIRQIFYLHRRGASGSTVFYAGFKSDSDVWHYSTDFSRGLNSTIEVRVLTPEPYKSSDYTLVRKRVDGGGEDEGSVDPESPDFDLHPVTTDYWLLDYRAGTFYTADFVTAHEGDLEADVNTSIVRWESTYGNEVYHSYTGYAFQNHGQAEPKNISFDDRMAEVLGRNDFATPITSQYEAGLLLIANFRNRDRRLDAVRDLDEYAKMSKPLRVRLRDSKGNEHVVQLDYLPRSIIGDRNVLVHSVPSRPSGQSNVIRLTNRLEGAE